VNKNNNNQNKTALPTLAVITRMSRSAKYLERVLAGLLLQKNVELRWVIVSQDQPSENHERCISRARDHGLIVHLVEAEQDIPLGKLANIGVKAKRSDFVLLHDDDDALRKNFTSHAMTKFNNHAVVAVACHAAIVFENDHKSWLNFVLSPGKKRVNAASLSEDNLIATNALIYTRQAYDKIGGYPEDVPVAEDWLFNQKLLKIGEIAVLARVCSNVYVRQGVISDQSERNTDKAFHQEMADSIRKMTNVDAPNLEARQRKPSERFLRMIDRLTFRLGGLFIPRH
jgi:hypothetical protein